MRIQHQTLEAPLLQTIAWAGDDTIIDWAEGGRLYGLDGSRSGSDNVTYGFSFPFDSAITSADGRYAFVYQKLGTKGVLLRDGEELREINRSYYQAGTYEYPAAFATMAGITYLVHCPVKYCQLDFEDVETGELVTNTPGRESNGCFHSRLEISPEGGYLMSKGWFWHPWDIVDIFDIGACLANPQLLDTRGLLPNTNTELCSAGFLTEHYILLATSDEEAMDDEEVSLISPGHLGFYSLKTNEFSAAVKVNEPFGNVFPLSDRLAWDLYQHPKITDLTIGEVVARLETLDTGWQRLSIIQHNNAPAIIFNRRTGRIALKNGPKIEVLSVAR
jgi:hypothetical protein